MDTVWTALIILCLLIIFGIYIWAGERKQQRTLREAMTDHAVDIIYDSTGSVKEQAKELRRITYTGRRNRE